MSDYEQLRPFPQRRRSDMVLKQPADDAASSRSAAHGTGLRQQTSIPRIASLDVLVTAARIDGADCPSIKSDGSQSSSHRLSPTPAEQGDGIFFQGRDHTDRSVSLDLMVNTLHYVMMTKPVLNPVPIEYNACILHLLEGYWKLQEQLRKTEQALNEEKETKERSLEEFTKMSAEWEKKEADFLAEIKRMELVLAKVAPDGVGAVVIARSGSVVDRSSRSSRLFKDRVEKAKGSPEKGQNTDNHAIVDDSFTSVVSGSPRRTHTTVLSMRPNLNGNADAELSEQLRNARRRQYWATKYFGPEKVQVRSEAETTPHRAMDDSEEGQNTAGLSARSTTTDLPRRVVTMTDPLQTAIGPVESYVNADTTPGSASYRTPGVDEERTETATSGDKLGHRSLTNNLEASMGTFGEGTDDPERKHSEVQRHRRDFSFDPGEDGIPLAPLASRIRSPDCQDKCADDGKNTSENQATKQSVLEA